MYTRKSLGAGFAVALVALAFTALPAMASGAELVDAGGPVPAEEQVVLSGSFVKNNVVLGTLRCKSVRLSGTVTTNSEGEVTVKPSPGEDVAEECDFPRAGPTSVEVEFQELHLTDTWSTLSIRLVEVSPFYEYHVCSMEGTVPVTAVESGESIFANGYLTYDNCINGSENSFTATFTMSSSNGPVMVQ